MIKTIFKIFLILLVVALITALYLFNTYKSTLDASISDNSTTKVFVIDPGLSAYQVLDKLKTEGVLTEKQETVLKIHIRFETTPAFKEGSFKIPLNTKLKELVTLLENPVLTDVWVTIPEGLRKDEIAKILTKSYKDTPDSPYSEKEFLKLTNDSEYIYSLGLTGVKDLEGYLYPDKYLMPAQATTDYIIRTLVSTFKERADKITYEQLIIASMIEREGLNNTDRPMISDVIRKRQKDGWLLQIDATLLYYYKDWKHVITVADKELDQPYNTYKRLGLPPTPICNPGISAINAAKNPKKNPYYFYIHSNDGNVYFATTLAEHESNIAKYLR